MAHREAFLNAAVSFRNHDAFKILHSLLAALDDLIAYFHRIAHVKRRDFGFQAFRIDSFD